MQVYDKIQISWTKSLNVDYCSKLTIDSKSNDTSHILRFTSNSLLVLDNALLVKLCCFKLKGICSQDFVYVPENAASNVFQKWH